jgi:hypothetical protein
LGSALATIGLYGLLAYTVARRVNEIGVRMALGETERDLTRMVLRGALGLVCAWLVVGAPIALWSRHVAASLVQNLPASNALPIAFAALAMIAMALLAAYLPARRACARWTPCGTSKIRRTPCYIREVSSALSSTTLPIRASIQLVILHEKRLTLRQRSRRN